MSTADSSTAREDASMGSGIIAVVGTFTAISALFVAARLYVRIKLMHNTGLDDYLIVLAMICGIINLGISSAAAEAGSGRHMDTLTLEQQQNVVKYTIAAFCPGILSFAIPKLAVVSLLTKLLAPSQAHTVFLWCSSGLTTAALLGCVIILYARCTPTHMQWDFSVKGECFSIWILVRYGIFAGSLSAAMDLYLAVYPAVILARLQMNIRKKMALASALGIGSVACIVAAYKCSRLPGLATNDFSYDTANLVIWTCIEGSTIIIASCIPILQPLVKVICDSSILSSARRGAGYSSNTPHQKSTHDSGIELSSELVKSGKAFSRARIGVSIPTEIDSQEQILAREESQERDHGYPRAVETNITRTDEVTVSYSSG